MSLSKDMVMNIVHTIIEQFQSTQQLSPKLKDEITLKILRTIPSNLIIDKYDYEILVLSGGGKKGIAQLGLLHGLYINKVIDFNKINTYVGTSIGAIINFLLIIEYSPVEIFSHACTKQIESSKNMKINITNIFSNFGCFDSNILFDNIIKITEDKLGFIPTLLELYEIYGKHFIAVVHNLSSDIYNGDEETLYIDHISNPNLSCIELLKMSSNIPVIFEKYLYDKNYYIDGALSDNYPIEYTHRRFGDNKKILGICVGKHGNILKEKINDNKSVNIIDYIKLLLTISYRSNNNKSLNYSNGKNIHSISMIIDDVNDKRFDLSTTNNFLLFSIGYKSSLKLIKGEKEVVNEIESDENGGEVRDKIKEKQD
jgi:predicted acylesterase/phospholipase RssA